MFMLIYVDAKYRSVQLGTHIATLNAASITKQSTIT